MAQSNMLTPSSASALNSPNESSANNNPSKNLRFHKELLNQTDFQQKYLEQ